MSARSTHLAWRCCATCHQQHLGGWHRTMLGDPCPVDDGDDQ